MIPRNGKACLIGLGGIGFRHFQALLNSKCLSELFVIDISEEALDKAEKEEKIEGSRPIHVIYGKDYSILPNELDVLIIATSSLVRREVFENIIKRCSIKYVVFEKILFPKIEDYDVIGKILKAKDIKAYVNCPGRMYEGYKYLKQKLSGQPIVFIETGTNWGLACNLIHIIDEVGFLMDCNDEITIDSLQIDNEIAKSKRSGYIDFTGKIVCRMGDKATIIADSFKTGDEPLKVTLVDGKTTYTFSEIDQTIIEFDGNNSKEGAFPIYYQSQLTDKVFDGLLTGGDCELTRFENSIDWHKSLLNAFKKKYDQIENQVHDLCPIT